MEKPTLMTTATLINNSEIPDERKRTKTGNRYTICPVISKTTTAVDRVCVIDATRDAAPTTAKPPGIIKYSGFPSTQIFRASPNILPTAALDSQKFVTLQILPPVARRGIKRPAGTGITNVIAVSTYYFTVSTKKNCNFLLYK